MTKKRPKSDTAQITLFELIESAQKLREAPLSEGSLNIERRIRLAVSDALKSCRLSVHQVAGEMSHLLDETITSDMLYSWTAESKSLHQVWACRLPAFCRATGSRRPLEIMVEAAGMFCLPGPEALRAEIQRLAEEERRVRKEKRKREIFLAEIAKDAKEGVR